jgi:hypothetical protein
MAKPAVLENVPPLAPVSVTLCAAEEIQNKGAE